MPEEEKESLERLLETTISEYSQEYRIQYIISLLLNNPTPYTIALFADDLYVSKNTIQNDLKKAQKWLSEYRLEIQRIPGTGISVTGDEFSIRKALVVVNRSRVLPLSDNQKTPVYDSRFNRDTNYRIHYFYRSQKILDFVDIIHRLEKATQRPLSAESFLMLLEYLLVQSQRNLQGFILEHFENRLELAHNAVLFSFSQTLAYSLKEKKLIEYNLWELEYIYYLTCSLDYQSRQGGFIVTATPYEVVVESIIEYTSQMLGLNLQEDTLLRDKLSSFIVPSMIRTYYGFQLDNPLKDEVKKEYPAIFNVAYAAGRFYQNLCSRYPSEHEISYLALHLGGATVRTRKQIKTVILSASGTAVSELTEQRLLDRLPDLDIIRTVPFSEQTTILGETPQLIVTTVPNYAHKTIPTISISPQVTDQDIRKFRRIKSQIYTKITAPSNAVVNHLFSPDLIFLDQSFPTRKKVIEFAVDKLYKKGCVTKGFFQKAMQREYVSSTAIGKRIAIPHSISTTVLKPAICIVSLAKAIDWEDEPVDLVFVLALDFVNIENTRAFYKHFYALTTDDDFAQKIRNAPDRASVVDMIEKKGDVF